MVLPALTWSDVWVLAAAALVLTVPGTVVGLSAGLRGWRLAACAPLLSYGVAGLSGPWSTALGIPWNPLVLAIATVLFASVVAGVRAVVRTGPAPTSGAPWTRTAQLAVAVCVLVAAGIGLVGTVVGLGGLGGLLGGWDAGFHANGVRWIVETGDAGVYGMTQVNWYGSPPRFYPNAYHLLCAVTAQIVPGPDIPAVLNATTALTPAVFALGLAALVARAGGRAVLAGVAALLVVAVGPLVDLYYYGPVLPFATSLALVPAGLVLTADAVVAPGRRAGVGAGLVLALAASALLALHPGVLVTAVLFALPMLGALWWTRRETVLPSTVTLLGAGALTLVVCGLQVAGSLSTTGIQEFDWPAVMDAPEALGQALLFQHGAETPQLWLALGFGLGLLSAHTLGGLRWLVVSVAGFGALFVVAASVDTDWSAALTGPWWNDRWRLVAITALGMTVLAAHGFAELHRRLRDVVTTYLRAGHPLATRVSGGLAVVLVVGLVGVTDGLYLGASEARVRNSVGAGAVVTYPTVNPGEEAGYAFLGAVVPPGERVMNDRWDGSVWMYALHGVHPVYGHYDATGVSPDQILLAGALNRYDTDPAVRAAAARLRVGWAAVGRGSVVDDDTAREPGLVGLETVRSFREVYRNDDITVYRLAPVPAPSGPSTPSVP